MTKRYTYKNEFPPYSFVPGFHPHPRSDPEGHSYSLNEKNPMPFNPNNYLASEEYLFGIDLFNFGYYWEAHEKWESLWHLEGKAGITADFLKGLIRLTAAGVKIRQKQPEGAIKHSLSSYNIFEGIIERTQSDIFAGIDLNKLIQLCKKISDNALSLDSNPEKKVEILIDFVLGIEEE